MSDFAGWRPSFRDAAYRRRLEQAATCCGRRTVTPGRTPGEQLAGLFPAQRSNSLEITGSDQAPTCDDQTAVT